MTINHQFGDVDARGATIRAQAASREADHWAVISRRARRRRFA
jgi:hypothetical protein